MPPSVLNKEIAKDETLPMEERFKARLKLAKLPRNSREECTTAASLQDALMRIIGS